MPDKGRDQSGIHWILANAGKKPKGLFKELAERYLRDWADKLAKKQKK